MRLLPLKILYAFVLLLAQVKSTFAQKQVKEVALIYDLAFIKQGAAESKVNDETAELKIWIKSNQSRSETSFKVGKETSFFNQEKNKGVLLKEFRGQELLVVLTSDNWMEKNALFQHAKFKLTDVQQKINGMQCKQAIASIPGGKIIVYYNPDLIITNTKFDLAFPDLQGLPVKVEWVGGPNESTSMAFTLKQISFENIPQTKFDFPSSEKYKTISFEEAKKSRGVN